MAINFEIPVEYLYEMQRKLDTFDQVKRYTETYCQTQVESKKELIKWMHWHLHEREYTFIVVGAWYGTLIVPYLVNNFKIKKLILNDIDTSVRRILKSYTKKFTDNFEITHYNMFETSEWHQDLSEDNVIINTSCEHMRNMYEFHDGYSNVIYALQSNNYYDHPEHINCVADREEFILKSGLQEVFFTNEIPMKEYKRFTLLGSR